MQHNYGIFITYLIIHHDLALGRKLVPRIVLCYYYVLDPVDVEGVNSQNLPGGVYGPVAISIRHPIDWTVERHPSSPCNLRMR